MGLSELLIKNRLSPELGNVKVRIYPVGTFFKQGDANNSFFPYSAFARDPPLNSPYITGGEKILIPYVFSDPIDLRSLFRINQDGTGGGSACDLTVGYGKYQVDIMYDFGSGWQIIESFTMDWSDSDYYLNYSNGANADIKVYVLDTNDIGIHFSGSNETEPWPILLSYHRRCSGKRSL